MGCYCDYDGPEFLNKQERVARKGHRCCECYRTIQPGERYTHATGRWDGTFSTFKRCGNCSAVQQALQERLPCYCWYWGGLYEDEGLPEYLNDLRRAETGDYFAVMRLIVAAKRAKCSGWRAERAA